LSPEISGFVKNSKGSIVAYKSIKEPVGVKAMFNPEQIDGISNIDVLPQLKPSSMNYEVLVL
jgi:hypothetical protein